MKAQIELLEQAVKEKLIVAYAINGNMVEINCGYSNATILLSHVETFLKDLGGSFLDAPEDEVKIVPPIPKRKKRSAE